MRLHEIKNITDESLYESFMSNDELLEEGAKELFAAGMKKMGAAAEKLKDAADAPAQKAWAEVQSRLATAGKDDAIGKLKAFASKHKIAIGTLAIIGAGLLTATDASADSMYQAAGGDNLMGALFQGAVDGGADQETVGNALQNLEVQGVSAQDYAAKAEQAAENAGNYVDRNNILKQAGEKIRQALANTIGGGEGGEATQVADASGAGSQSMGDGSQHTDSAGRKVNFGKTFTDDMRRASEINKRNR